MDKEVKIRLPKGKKVELINTSVKDNNIVVKYELVDEFVPKNGDIVFIKKMDSKEPCISIFEKYECGKVYTHIDFHTKSNIFYSADMSGWHLCAIDEIYILRLATEEETAKLYSVLKEKGLVWNEETKKVQKIRWRAKRGCVYYSIDKFGNVFSLVELADASDNINYINGAYFETEEQANIVAGKIKEIYKSNV